MVPVDIEYMREIAKDAVSKIGDSVRLKEWKSKKTGYRILDVVDSNDIVLYCVAREVVNNFCNTKPRVIYDTVDVDAVVSKINDTLKSDYYYFTTKQQQEKQTGY